ncbi:hypothetical protein K469DRAFT_716546 [Zopfia rhizophila CBS 207.26]|uniref:Uncharacterized protein n=1 Tax=Zopfia rhizophila CBS 207.26 TaxID=1314779 RepID=A0A6A6DID0_9PEZI|nr:hypothetical protein K469DRAFT_716546 [Zopfia rhizophila CBS 207.26]
MSRHRVEEVNSGPPSIKYVPFDPSALGRKTKSMPKATKGAARRILKIREFLGNLMKIARHQQIATKLTK